MTYTTLAAILLICVSGFIAYFGDLLGRRMGKKRLTLFNMRPRYTAIVVTTITGMVISALALTVLVSIDPTFRKIFTQGERIYKQNRQLTQRNQWLTKLGKDLRLAIVRQEKELRAALKDAVDAKRQRDVAKEIVVRLRKEIALRQSELADLRKRTGITEAELKDKRSELRLMQSQLEREQEQLRVAQTQVTKAQQQLGAIQASLKVTQAKLNAADSSLLYVSGLSETALDHLLSLRLNHLAFQQGDELVRGIIKPRQSGFALGGDLYSLLDQASAKAIEGGAKAGDNGRAVTVMYRQNADSSNALVNDNERECVDLAVSKIASANADVVVQVLCGMNTLPGSQVSVELRLYVNEQVFRKGQVIATAKIDGHQSEGRILVALDNFLRKDVAKAAVKAGIAPVPGQDPWTGLGKNREAQADELLGLVAKIKAMDAPAKVSVYATADIYTADCLTMDNFQFSVKAE